MQEIFHFARRIGVQYDEAMFRPAYRHIDQVALVNQDVVRRKHLEVRRIEHQHHDVELVALELMDGVYAKTDVRLVAERAYIHQLFQQLLLRRVRCDDANRQFAAEVRFFQSCEQVLQHLFYQQSRIDMEIAPFQFIQVR